jgi:two-component system osmolarity sensor histidine kinase EnvZ
VPAAAAIGRGELPPPLPESGPQEVAALGRAFNEMARDVRSLDQDRKLLLAGISHDLRTPLARLRLGIELLPPGADASLGTGMVQDIEDMDAIIDQFLSYVREGSNEEAAIDTDLGTAVRAVVERYERRGQPVRAHAGEMPKVRLRPLSFQRLLSNLIDNALRHGGGQVEVRAGRSGASNAQVSVLDRGPGIPEAERARMLQPFQRIGSARTDPGSGLGLAIVDRIARLHGGRVLLEGREGGGLKVTVELPIT